MTRLRFDAVSGSVDISAFNSGSTNFQSTGLAKLGVVNFGNTADITLYFHNPGTNSIAKWEVIRVTTHASGAATATVTRAIRGGGSTTMPSGGWDWPMTSTWTHGATTDDFSPSAIGAVAGVTAGDGTITVGGTSTNPTISVGTVPNAKVSGLGSAALADTSAFDVAGAALLRLPLAGGIMTGPIAGFQDKGGQVFNVMAYGAKGDGTTDDTTAIETAIAAVQAVQVGGILVGGILYFPVGTYIVSRTLKIPSWTTVRGASRMKSSIKQANNANLDAVISTADWATQYNITTYATMTDLTNAVPSPTIGYMAYVLEYHSVYRWSGSPPSWTKTGYVNSPVNFEHLNIDGNGVNQSASVGQGNGLVVCSFQNHLNDVEVHDTRGHGVLISDANYQGYLFANTQEETHLFRVSVRRTGKHGIYVKYNGGGLAATDGFIHDCIVANSGYNFNNPTFALMANAVTSLAPYAAIRVESAGGWKITGNHVYSLPGSGIEVSGWATKVNDNYIESFGFGAVAGTYYGIANGTGTQVLNSGGNVISTALYAVAGEATVIAENTIRMTSQEQGFPPQSGTKCVGISNWGSNAVGDYIATIVGNTLVTSNAGSTWEGIRVGMGGSSSTRMLLAIAANVCDGWPQNKNYTRTPGSGTLTVVGDVFSSSLALSGTNGFANLPGVTGVPTGTPNDVSGGIPVVIDITDGTIYAYYGTAWHSIGGGSGSSSNLDTVGIIGDSITANGFSAALVIPTTYLVTAVSGDGTYQTYVTNNTSGTNPFTTTTSVSVVGISSDYDLPKAVPIVSVGTTGGFNTFTVSGSATSAVSISTPYPNAGMTKDQYFTTTRSRQGYHTWANLFLNHRFTVIHGDGVPGASVINASWPVRIQALIDANPSIAIVAIGTNDIGNGRSFNDIVFGGSYPTGCGLQPTISALKSAGIKVVMNLLPPRQNVSNSAYRTTLGQVNSWIREQAGAQGIYVCDTASVLMDASLGTPTQYKQINLGVSTPGTTTSSLPIDTPLVAPIVQGTYIQWKSSPTAQDNLQYVQVALGGAAIGATTIPLASAKTIPAGSYICVSPYTADGVHPTQAGARAWGRELAKTLDPLLPKTTIMVEEYNSQNLLSAAQQNWTTGAVSYNFSGATVTTSKVPRTDGVEGQWTKLVLSDDATGYIGITCSLSGLASTLADKQLITFVEIATANLQSNYTANPSPYRGQGVNLVVIGAINTGQPSGVSSNNSYFGDSGNTAVTIEDPVIMMPDGVMMTPKFFPNDIGQLRVNLSAGTYSGITMTNRIPFDLKAGEKLIFTNFSTASVPTILVVSAPGAKMGDYYIPTQAFTTTVDVVTTYSRICTYSAHPVPSVFKTISGTAYGPSNLLISLGIYGGGTYYLGRVGIIPIV